MRRGLRIHRIPRTGSDEVAAHIQQNGISMLHQPRVESTQCPTCWNKTIGDYSTACSVCNGSGFLISSIRRMKGILSMTQPWGAGGSSAQTNRSGGTQSRSKFFILIGLKEGTEIRPGDALVIRLGEFRDEYVIMNSLPLLAGMVVIAWNLECESLAVRRLDGVIF
jgi:hypothetical protein